MTGGYNRDNKIRSLLATDKTEMMTMSGSNWKFVASANLPMSLVDHAALTLNNQVYLFGNLSELQINH